MAEAKKKCESSEKKRKERGGHYDVVCFLERPDGTAVPFDELTPEEVADWKAKMSERLCRVMSRYYAQHPEEYERLESLE